MEERKPENQSEKKTGRKIIVILAFLLLLAGAGYCAWSAGYSAVFRKQNSGEEITGEKENSKGEGKQEKPAQGQVDGKDEANASQKPQESSEDSSGNPGSASSSASTSDHKPSASQSGSSSGKPQSESGPSGTGKASGHYETRYETIPAYDEEVLVKEGYYESVLVKEAWDEEDTYCYAFGQDQVEVYVCNQCGATFNSGSEANDHLDGVNCGGWHNEYVLTGEPYCKEYKTDYIHHDAVYDRVWHEPEYKTVHHPEEIRSYEVWVED